MKSILKLTVLLFICISIGIYSYNRSNYTDIEQWELQIEALAYGEGGSVDRCIGTGIIDCAGEKVDYASHTR